MNKNDIANIENINESQVPSIIKDQFSKLSVLRKKVDEASEKAEHAQSSVESANNKPAGLFQKKIAIESLQEAAVDLADAQISAAQAQEVSFEYQQKLGEITKYLFWLGVTNIAMNRSVVRELEMKLKGASEEELDEFARQEIIGVVRQLKAQEDIMKKQGELTNRVKEHESKLALHKKKDTEFDRKFKEHLEHEKKQDDILQKQTEKDKEHDRLLAEKTKKDKIQDEELVRQAAKDEELGKRIDESNEKNKSQDKEIARLAAKDEALDKLVDELKQSNLEKENQIRELKTICEELSAKIELGSSYIDDVESGLINKIDEKASKKENLVAYLIGTVALIVTIVQFFI